jgi:SNF2 family DNA or RNA helicase
MTARLRSAVSADSTSQLKSLLALQSTQEPYRRIAEGFAPFRPTYAQTRGIKDHDFQASGSTFLIENDKAILGDDMGLGKCKMLCDAVMHRWPRRFVKDQSTNVIIVCKASNIDTWLEEIPKWCGPDVPVHAYRGSDRRVRAEDWFASIEYMETPTFFVVSYSTYRSDWDTLTRIPFDWAVLDEMQEIRSSPLNNDQSQIAQVIHYLKPEIQHGLTGTPVMNSAADLWNPLYWLGADRRTWPEFARDTLVIKQKRVTKTQVRNKVSEELPHGLLRLRKILERYMLRRLKEDVLEELPEKIFSRRYVHMSPSEVRAYKELDHAHAKALTNKAGGDVLLMRMQQATSSIQSKVNDVVEIMEEMQAQGRKVLIFTQWIDTLRMLYRGLKQYNIAYVYGGMSPNAKPGEKSDRQKMVDKFQNDPTCRAMIATIQTAGVGLTLTAGSVVVLVDRPWNPKLVEQAIDRLARIGQMADSIYIYSLYAVIPDPNEKDGFRHTVEWGVQRALASKTATADAVVVATK